MANKGLEAFDSFTAGVLSKITDPDQKRKAEEAVTALKAISPVAQAIGDGVVGQSEISRTLDTLKTQREELVARQEELDQREAGLTDWHGRLNEWHTANRDALAAARQQGGGGGRKPGDPDPKAATPPAGLTEDQFNERMTSERANFLGFSRDQNQITAEHFAKFGEIVPLEPLLHHPKIAEVGLLGVYQLVHKDRLDKWTADAEKKKEDTIRADERRKVLESSAQMPYPPPTGAGSGSPLDALVPAGKEPVVDAAVAHYNRLQQERDGARSAS